MSEIEKRAAERLEKVLPQLNDYNKGRLIGIGEGIAMALENSGTIETGKEAHRDAP